MFYWWKLLSIEFDIYEVYINVMTFEWWIDIVFLNICIIFLGKRNVGLFKDLVIWIIKFVFF